MNLGINDKSPVGASNVAGKVMIGNRANKMVVTDGRHLMAPSGGTPWPVGHPPVTQHAEPGMSRECYPQNVCKGTPSNAPSA